MKQKHAISFEFQEVPLDEAESLVMAGSGNYSEVKAMLLQKLPEIETRNLSLPIKERKGFAFGLGKQKEIEERARRGLCMSINATLKKAGVFWKITYSNKKKLFICVPKQPKRMKGIPTMSEAKTILTNTPMSLHDFEKIAMRTFKIESLLGTKVKLYRKAFCIIGRRLGFNNKQLSVPTGITPDGVSGLAHSKNKSGQLEIKYLENAISTGAK